MIFVNECLTLARVEKLLYKLVDETLLEEQFGIEDMGLILKHLGARSYEDMMKEESDSLENYEEKKLKNVLVKSCRLL